MFSSLRSPPGLQQRDAEAVVTAMEEMPRKRAQTAMKVYRWGLGEAASPLLEFILRVSLV